MGDLDFDPVPPCQERKVIDFRVYGLGAGILLGHYGYSYAHKGVPEHNHGNGFEILIVEEGVQPFNIGETEYLLSGGDVLVIPPFNDHSSGENPENKGKLYWLCVEVPGENDTFLHLTADESRLLFNKLKTIPRRHFRGTKQIKGCLDKMFEIHEKPDDLSLVELKTLILRFLLDVIRCSGRAERSVSPLIARIQEYIEKNIQKADLPLWELADIAGLGESHFKRRFKAETGISPGNYITLRKIENAKSFLLDTEKSITEIAMDMGFASSQYFATSFKRYTGCTPSSFRRDK